MENENDEFKLPELNFELENETDDQNDDDQKIESNDDLNVDDDLDSEEEESNDDSEENSEEEDFEETDETDESDLVNPVFNMLKSRNYFFNVEEDKLEEPKTVNEFAQLIDDRNKAYDEQVRISTRKSIVDRFPTRVQKIIDAASKNPEPITDDLFLELVTTVYESNNQEFKLEDLDDEDKASKFMLNKLVNDGYDEDIAEDFIAGLKDKNKLVGRAKIEFEKDIKSGNTLVDKFVESVETNVKSSKIKEAQKVENFNNALKETGWSEDKIKAIKANYASGKTIKQIKALLNNPNLLPYLLDFASFVDGKKIHLDKYKEHAFSVKRKELSKDIRDKAYFAKKGKKSTIIPF